MKNKFGLSRSVTSPIVKTNVKNFNDFLGLPIFYAIRLITSMRKFLRNVIWTSEKAASIARACRKEDDLFQLLVEVNYQISNYSLKNKLNFYNFHLSRKRKETIKTQILVMTSKPWLTY